MNQCLEFVKVGAIPQEVACNIMQGCLGPFEDLSYLNAAVTYSTVASSKA